MERNDHVEAELIDLGSVAEETKGGGVIGLDQQGFEREQTGLADD